MDAAETNKLISGYLELATIELFHDIGADFACVERNTSLPDITAIIGFAGTGIAGSLALCTSHDCLSELAKLGNTKMTEDWLGELSNQLLGRVKRRLSPHGASFGLSTPVVISGDRLRLSASAQVKPPISTCVASSLGRAEVWLEIEFRDGFTLTDQPEEDGSLIEGEALLF